MKQKEQRTRLVQVVDAFLHGRVLYGKNLLSFGSTLYSYGEAIATHAGSRVILVGKRAGVSSRTISRHKAMVRDMSTALGIEVEEV